MPPVVEDQGMACLPWSPLARGRFARAGQQAAKTSRAGSDEVADRLCQAPEDEVLDALARGVPPAQIAIAWLLHQPAVTSSIIGVTKWAHLDDPFAAPELELSSEELDLLEAPYRPIPVAGHR